LIRQEEEIVWSSSYDVLITGVGMTTAKAALDNLNLKQPAENISRTESARHKSLPHFELRHHCNPLDLSYMSEMDGRSALLICFRK